MSEILRLQCSIIPSLGKKQKLLVTTVSTLKLPQNYNKVPVALLKLSSSIQLPLTLSYS